jgi:uncharacterized protein
MLACGLAFIAPGAVAASFPCDKATSAVERGVCSDAAIGELDERLARAYAAALAPFSATAKRALRADQRRWAESRDLACGSYAKKANASALHVCLKASYEERLVVLSNLAVRHHDLLLYPMQNKVGDTWMQIDSSEPFLRRLNTYVRLPERTPNPDEEEGHDNEITVLTDNLLAIRIGRWVQPPGAMHSSGEDEYHYYSRREARELKVADVFRDPLKR